MSKRRADTGLQVLPPAYQGPKGHGFRRRTDWARMTAEEQAPASPVVPGATPYEAGTAYAANARRKTYRLPAGSMRTIDA